MTIISAYGENNFSQVENVCFIYTSLFFGKYSFLKGKTCFLIEKVFFGQTNILKVVELFVKRN